MVYFSEENFLAKMLNLKVIKSEHKSGIKMCACLTICDIDLCTIFKQRYAWLPSL